MFNRRIIFLTIISTISVPMFSMQDNLERLMLAAKNGDLQTIKTLDPHGEIPAMPSGPDAGLSLLCVAASEGHLPIVDYYVKEYESHGKEINPPTTTGQFLGQTPLFIAASFGRLPIVEYFVNKLENQGKDINPALTAGEDLGWTPQYVAAAEGRLTVVDYYVKKLESQGKGINPALTAGEDLENTPLYVAAAEGRLTVVDYYVKKLESQDKNINPALTAGPDLGWTPLHVASAEDKQAIVYYYVKNLESLSKDINPALTAGQNLGVTPLNAAASAGHLDVVKILIYRGALLTAKNSEGKTAEDIARANNQLFITTYLHITAPLTQQLLKICIRTKSLIAALAENYQKLLKQPQLQTFLNESIETNRGQLKKSLHQIKKLIRQGAEANAQGKKGYSPLHCLIGYYNPEGPTKLDEETRTLIDSGSVNIDAVADNGDTALSLAAQYGNSRIFKYLLQKGANPSIGKNPFLVAIQHNQMHIVRFLPGHEEQTASYGSKK